MALSCWFSKTFLCKRKWCPPYMLGLEWWLSAFNAADNPVLYARFGDNWSDRQLGAYSLFSLPMSFYLSYRRLRWHGLQLCESNIHYVAQNCKILLLLEKNDYLLQTHSYSIKRLTTPSRREEHDGVLIMALYLSLQKLSAKNNMVNLGHLRHFRGHHLILRFKYWYCWVTPVKANIFVFISSRFFN